MCNCHSILEWCFMFSGVKLSIRSFNLSSPSMPKEAISDLSKLVIFLIFCARATIDSDPPRGS